MDVPIYGLESTLIKTTLGFKHIILSPHIDLRDIIPAGQKRITYVDASYESHYGKISSSWKINEKKDNIKYDFTIPANTTATVILHLQDKYNKIKCNQRSLNKVSGIISHKDRRYSIHNKFITGKI